MAIGKMIRAEARAELELAIEWDDGFLGICNLAPLLSRVAALEPLLNKKTFGAVRLSDDGWSLEWPGGIDFGAPQIRRWCEDKASLLAA